MPAASAPPKDAERVVSEIEAVVARRHALPPVVETDAPAAAARVPVRELPYAEHAFRGALARRTITLA